MKYKKSKYNIIAKEPEAEKDDVVIYNTWQCKFATLPKEQYEFLQSKELFEKNELPQQLINDRFVVLEALDETSTMLKQKRQYRGNEKPSYVKLEVCTSYVCQHHCSYCFEKALPRIMMTEEVEFDLVTYIKREVDTNNNLKIMHITWFGGEPLLGLSSIQRISKEIIPYLKEKGVTYRADLLTNGSLLTEETSNILLNECNITHIQVTLDGFAETYAKVRGVNKEEFEKVLRNLETAKQKLFIRLNFIKENAEELVLLSDYLKKRFGDKIVINYAKVRSFDNETKDKVLSWDDFDKYNEAYYGECDDATLYFDDVTLPRYECTFCTNKNVIIGADGNIYRCDIHIGQEDKIIGALKKGIDKDNVLHKEFTENFKLDNKCNACEILPFCLGGCYAKYQQGVRPCNLYRKRLQRSIDHYLQQQGKV